MHRDIKPANVFLCHDGEDVERAKVIDFGLAKMLARESGFTFTESILGSPNYMAPEQMEKFSPLPSFTSLPVVE